MNLYDLVKRPDRAVQVAGAAAQALEITTRNGPCRAVQLAPGSTLTLRDAHEFTALWQWSDDLGWAMWRADADAAFTLPALALQIRSTEGHATAVPVPVRAGCSDLDRVDLRLDWPQAVVAATAFDLQIHNPSSTPLTLLCGPLVNMRRHLLPLARGVGVEVGPGLRPHVLPGPGVDVLYVEEQDPRDWLRLYNKTGPKPALPPEDLLQRYVRASAVALDGVAPGSLDFVFSNHVFEHLPNPLLVLDNWRRCLRPGAWVLGVTPDPRYSFDCRQPPTTLHHALADEQVGGHRVTQAQLERWCRYTEPRHTPQDLQRRGYSIHVSFFTPESFGHTAHELQSRGWFDRVFITTATNHKDFGFALRRAA